jgi:hypothetical protein
MKVNNAVVASAVENLFSLWSIAIARHDEGESQRDELLGTIKAIAEANPKTADRVAESVRLFGSGRVGKGETKIDGIIPTTLRERIDAYVATMEKDTGVEFNKMMLKAGRDSINTDVSACRRILSALCYDSTYALRPTFHQSKEAAPATTTSNRKGKTKTPESKAPPAGSNVGEFEKYVRDRGSKGDAELLAVARALHLLLQAMKDTIGAVALAAIEKRYKAAA